RPVQPLFPPGFPARIRGRLLQPQPLRRARRRGLQGACDRTGGGAGVAAAQLIADTAARKTPGTCRAFFVGTWNGKHFGRSAQLAVLAAATVVAADLRFLVLLDLLAGDA